MNTSRSLRSALATAYARVELTGRFPVIPDIKIHSPKEGPLIVNQDPAELAISLAHAGAPAISVVTESVHFHGSLQLLRSVANAVSVPILRKDFIKDTADLVSSCEAGASAVLLIAAQLSLEQLSELHAKAHYLGLETLVEVHTAEELQLVSSLDLDCLGINNRDILNLERDAGTVTHTMDLAKLAPPGVILISESGILSPADVNRVGQAGAHAALVGTAILQAPDRIAQFQALARAQYVSERL